MPIPEHAVPAAEGLTAWWKVRGRSFLGAVGVASVSVVGVGWITGLRSVMHGAILSIATVALLPFVVIAGGLLLLMVAGFVLGCVATLTGEPPAVDHGLYAAGEVLLGGGRWFARRYYRFIARQRHPLAWGVPAGVLFGGLMLWVLIAALVLPGEAQTVRILSQAKTSIDQIYQQAGQFPRPDRQGHLAASALGGASVAARVILVDGFGQPLQYEVWGKWPLASWRLVSLGFDGRAGADDLCASGTTKLNQWLEQADDLARLLEALGAGTASTNDELTGIRALQCPSR